MLPLREGFHAGEMVVWNSPTAVRLPLRSCARPAHRLQSADMAYGIALAGLKIVAQMKVDRVAAAIGAGDSIDHAVRRTCLRPDRFNQAGGVLGHCRWPVAPPEGYGRRSGRE